MSPLFPRNLLRPRLRVFVACPERAQASRAGALCGSIFDARSLGCAQLADSRSPSGSLMPAEQLNPRLRSGFRLRTPARRPARSRPQNSSILGCARDFACGLPLAIRLAHARRTAQSSAALGISLADSRSPPCSLTPAEQLNFTVFPAANYTRGFTAAVKERLRRCQKQPR